MKRLLIVDDEESILVGMRRYLAARGYHVDCAREREEAEALLCNVPYDCVIADLCLTAGHGPDGLAVITCARDADPATRIVVLTALGASETEQEARRLGVDAFLRKPIPMTEVATMLERLLEGGPS